MPTKRIHRKPPQRRKSGPSLLRRAVLVLGLLVLVAGANWGYRHYQRVLDLDRQIAELEARKQSLQQQKQEYEAELQWLQTPAAVEKIAREELGLLKAGEYRLDEVIKEQ